MQQKTEKLLALGVDLGGTKVETALVDKNGKIISPNMPEKVNDHFLDATRYALEGLGRLKQEVSYWDRVFAEELKPPSKQRFNKGV